MRFWIHKDDCTKSYSGKYHLDSEGNESVWAPELVGSDEMARHSKATDVWAFGMTIFVHHI